MSDPTFWCPRAVLPGGLAENVRFETRDGVLAAVTPGVPPAPGDTVLDGVAHPGFANAHSHAFHRGLRGRTNAGRGSFWTWRQTMYGLAARLTPERYEALATGVYAEMLAAGWTAVAEFHYVHHRPDGTPYGPPDAEPHAMELALVRAARTVGIRLTLLDTCYFAGGIAPDGSALPLEAGQRRFTDGDATAWLRRWHALDAAVRAETGPDYGTGVRLGAALHSVRGVPETALDPILTGLPGDVPLHVHLSEQAAENEACLRGHGVTPTALLARHGALTPRLTAVHATHLTAEDVAALGGAGATVALCPTTEADLADGIGPARELADAGAVLALGSDQHVVLDPLLEARGLEEHERLASGVRGRFAPAELVAALSTGGHRSLGLPGGALEAGAPADLVVLDAASPRTVGSLPGQLVLTATAADVADVVVAGRRVAHRGTILGPDGPVDPADLLGPVFDELHREADA